MTHSDSDTASLTAPSAGLDASHVPQALRQIVALLRERTGHDFRHYKPQTILRRIERRLQRHRLDDLASYYELLDADGDEAGKLFQELLIGVTRFFRDADEFAALQSRVVPQLFDGKGPGNELRAWVAACSTGEEACSLAILLAERAALLPAPPRIHVFATDVDERAVHAARAGVYPLAIADDVPPHLLARYFTPDGERYRLQAVVRETMLFAQHNLLRDPPFSRLDLISCRNFLIYLNRDYHRQVLELFHFALKPGGYLFLGSAETADVAPHLFEAVDGKSRLYQARAVARNARAAIPAPPARTLPAQGPAAAAPGGRLVPYADVHRRSAALAAPPSILIDAGGAMLHISDHAGAFLSHAGGEPTRDLLALVAPELQPELRTALFQVCRHGAAVSSAPVRCERDGVARTLGVTVHPVEDDDPAHETLLLVQFHESDAAAPPAPATSAGPRGDEGGAGDDAPSLPQLRDALHTARRRLQDTMDQADAAAAEARLVADWQRAAAADLGAALDEARGSQEELQSANEELTTVNARLRLKVDESDKAHDDLSNLIASTDIATIFLDRALCIKRYTPRVRDVFNVIPGDIGRPLAHLAGRIEYPQLVQDAAGVLDSLRPLEREVPGGHGRFYIVRIHPYRTLEDRIDGVVLTFFDITRRRAAEQGLRRSDERHRVELERQVRERTAELERSRDLLQATMDSSMDMIQVFEAVRDAAGTIVDFHWALNNHTSESRYGEVRGQSLLERNPGVVAEGIFDAFRQVVETGVPVTAERYYAHEQFAGWFLQSVVKLGDGVATTTKEITAWKSAQQELLDLRDKVVQDRLRASQQALRASEARHAFVLTLADALRPLDDAGDIVHTAARVLGEQLGTDRAYYVNIDEERQEFVVERDWHRPGSTSHARRYPLDAWTMPWLDNGVTWVVTDVDTDPVLPDAQRPIYRDNGIGAAIVVPLIKGGRLVATFVTNQRRPRTWTATEVALIEDAAERIWAAVERARMQATLRATIERLTPG